VHIAIIMDGNGRWAANRAMPRTFGHHQGVRRAAEIIRVSPSLGVDALTLYAFSTENWTRPAYEVDGIFRLLRVYMRLKLRELRSEGVMVRFVGRRERLSGPVQAMIVKAEAETAGNLGLKLSICVDYGGKDEIVRITRAISERVLSGSLAIDDISEAEISQHSDLSHVPNPDLIIRTGGDFRLSNFLLWQSAYSEFEFNSKLWPDFTSEDFAAAINKFQTRDRRFGGRPVKTLVNEP
jgi:undecaprenyl diphosphate synthase